MKRPGTPLLFILSNQPSPQQKNTAPPYGLPTPPNFPALPTTYYPTRVTFSFYSQPTAAPSWRKTPPLPTPLSHSPELPRCPSERPCPLLYLYVHPTPPSKKHHSSRRPSPRPQTFPLPASIARPGCLPHFTPAQPASFPAERCRPTRCPSPHPQTSLPFPTSTARPGCLLLFIPGQPPPPSEKTPPRPTGPPRTPKLSHPSQHLLPGPSNFLFLFPTNRPPPGGKHRPARRLFPTHPNFPTLPSF